MAAGPSPDTSGSGKPAGAGKILRSREASVVLVLALLCLAMSLTSSRETFFQHRNLHVIALQTSLLSIFAIGETLVIITGGIDLSLGSMIGFIGMLTAVLITRLGVHLEPGPAVALGVLLALMVATGIGAIHATLIHKLRLPPFVVTLASLLLLRSQALLLNNQLPVPLAEYPALLALASSIFPNTPYAIPVPTLVLLVVAVLTALALSRMKIGRYLYSVGSNEQATRLSGVNVYRVKLFAYSMSGLLGGVAGVLYAAYGAQGDPLAGTAYELDAVAAAVVGGANLMGGQGSVVGTLLGATLLHSILSSINLTLANPDLWRGTLVGGVLLFAVLVTALNRRRVE